jgi:hypothetical protein
MNDHIRGSPGRCHRQKRPQHMSMFSNNSIINKRHIMRLSNLTSAQMSKHNTDIFHMPRRRLNTKRIFTCRRRLLRPFRKFRKELSSKLNLRTPQSTRVHSRHLTRLHLRYQFSPNTSPKLATHRHRLIRMKKRPPFRPFPHATARDHCRSHPFRQIRLHTPSRSRHSQHKHHQLQSHNQIMQEK